MRAGRAALVAGKAVQASRLVNSISDSLERLSNTLIVVRDLPLRAGRAGSAPNDSSFRSTVLVAGMSFLRGNIPSSKMCTSVIALNVYSNLGFTAKSAWQTPLRVYFGG